MLKIPGTNSTLPIERNCADLAAIKIKADDDDDDDED